MKNINLDYHVNNTHWKGKLNILAFAELNPYIYFGPPNFKAKVFMYVDNVPCILALKFQL